MQFPTLNWRTTSAAVGFVVCHVISYLFPPAQPLCGLLDTVFVAFGLYSSADASRVQNVVNAVDQVVVATRVNLLQEENGKVAPVK